MLSRVLIPLLASRLVIATEAAADEYLQAMLAWRNCIYAQADDLVTESDAAPGAIAVLALDHCTPEQDAFHLSMKMRRLSDETITRTLEASWIWYREFVSARVDHIRMYGEPPPNQPPLSSSDQR